MLVHACVKVLLALMGYVDCKIWCTLRDLCGSWLRRHVGWDPEDAGGFHEQSWVLCHVHRDVTFGTGLQFVLLRRKFIVKAFLCWVSLLS